MNEDRENRRKWILTGLAVLAAIVTLTLGTRDSDDAKTAAAGATTTATAETPSPTETTPVDDGTASGDGGATTDDVAAGDVPLPAEIADDPIVKRLVKGRTLPFTAGPWQKQQWRDAVFSRLSAGAQARFDKVPYQDGFGIVIQ